MNISEFVKLFEDKPPPCDGCEHYSQCATHDLACCSYQAYTRAKFNSKAALAYRRRASHRDPTREWYEYTFNTDEDECGHQFIPHCPRCKGVASREAA